MIVRVFLNGKSQQGPRAIIFVSCCRAWPSFENEIKFIGGKDIFE